VNSKKQEYQILVKEKEMTNVTHEEVVPINTFSSFDRKESPLTRQTKAIPFCLKESLNNLKVNKQ